MVTLELYVGMYVCIYIHSIDITTQQITWTLMNIHHLTLYPGINYRRAVGTHVIATLI